MTRDELKAQIDDLMKKRADNEIDGDEFFQKMMKLTTSARDKFKRENEEKNEC